MAMQSQYNDDHNRLPGKRPRLMIDISPELRRRIKIAAAQKDLSITYEVANALFQRVRKGEITVAKATQALEDVLFPELVLNFLEYVELSKRAITLAQQYSLPATYDAHYLALAEHEKCEYWAADSRLCNAVRDKLPWVRQLSEYQSSMH